MKNLNIVTIGGGTGAPVVIRSLVKAGFSDLCCITAAMDSGGRTGMVRIDERGRVISVGDLWRNLLALIPESGTRRENVRTFTEMISYTDGRGRNLGYTLYYALLEKCSNNFLDVQECLEGLLEIDFSGAAIPVTLEPTTLNFKTESGCIYYGEHELDNHSMSKDMVQQVWVEPEVEATREAVESVEKASHIVFCPGSLYGSLISNLLPIGISGALRKSKATKILISNLVSTRNESHYFRPIDYWNLFKKYALLKRPFDVFVTSALSQNQFIEKHPQEALSYSREHSHFLGWENRDLMRLAEKGVKVIRGEFYSIVPETHSLRHDPQKLAKLFSKIIKN